MADIVRNGRLAEFNEMRSHLLRLTFIACLAPLSLTGCHHRYRANPDLSTEGYRYRTGVAVVGPERDTLRVAVVVVNESKQQRMLPMSHCPVYTNVVQVRVKAGGRTWNSEVFEQKQHFAPGDSTGKPMMEICVASLLVMPFPPGTSYTSVLKVPVREILGDSLPSSRYRVTARLVSQGGDGRKLDAGEIFLCNCVVRAINSKSGVK